MVESVLPNHYALEPDPENPYLRVIVENDRIDTTIEGDRFNNMPDNVKGIMAYQDQEPLHNLDTTQAALILNVKSKTNNRIVMGFDYYHSYTLPKDYIYLGALVSADKSQVYWVNDTPHP